MNIVRKTVFSWLQFASVNGITLLLSFCTLAALARSVDVRTLGIFALVQSYIRLVDALFGLQSTAAMIKMGTDALLANRTDDFRRLVKSCFVVEFTSQCAATGIAVAGILLFFDQSGLPHSAKLWALMYCLVIPTSSVDAGVAVLRLYNKFFLSSSPDLVGATIRLVGTLSCALIQTRPVAFLLVWLLGDIASNLTVIAFAMRELSRRGHGHLRDISTLNSKSLRSEFWRTVASTKLTTTIRSCTEQGDTVLVGLIYGPSGAAFLRIAKAFSSLVVQLGWPIHHVVAPQVTEMWISGQYERLRHFLFTIVFSTLASGTLIFAIFVSFTPSVIGLVYGEKYLDAANISIIYFAAYLLMLAGSPILPTIFALGRPIVYTYIHLIGGTAFAIVVVLLASTTILATGIAHIAYFVAWLVLGYAVILRAIRGKIKDVELVPIV